MQQSKTVKRLVIIAKIFFIWLLLQFFFQTLITYKLGLDSNFWKLIWMWKEIIIIGLTGFLFRYLAKRKQLRSFFVQFPLKTFLWIFIATVIITAVVSIGINGTGVSTRIMSVRYSMIGFFIFMIFFATTLLFFTNKTFDFVARYGRIIKALLVGSLLWRGVLWLMPNVLHLAGYNQFNYEGDVGIAPPAVYYTQYDHGYIRNQFVFERPISRGFFLIAFWPLFFILSFKKSSMKENLLRGSLYGLAIMSTFSRAARGVRIIQTIILILAQFPRKYRKIALRWFIPLILLFAIVTYFGQKEIISRDFSNTGHLRHIQEGIDHIAERPIRGLGAGTAGPASHQVEGIKNYNPENQYLQIWIEYGFLWFLWWIFLYGYLHWIGRRAHKDERQITNKTSENKKLLASIVFAFWLGILWLSIEGMVLHPFVDRMIVYPFVALFAIAYGLYFREKSV